MQIETTTHTQTHTHTYTYPRGTTQCIRHRARDTHTSHRIFSHRQTGNNPLRDSAVTRIYSSTEGGYPKIYTYYIYIYVYIYIRCHRVNRSQNYLDQLSKINNRPPVCGASFYHCVRDTCASTAPERQGVASGGLFCRRAAVYHAAAKNHRGTGIKFVTHDSSTRRRLDAVDADMLPVLWLPGPASAEKGTRRLPGSGVLHTNVRDLVSRVERLQQYKFQTCT